MSTDEDIDFSTSDYLFAETKIRSNDSISKKVQATCKFLADGDKQPAQATVYRLLAPAPVANKLISIVEIVKRERRKRDGMTVFQYSALKPDLVTTTSKTDLKADEKHDNEDHDDDDDAAFETMPDKPKKRNVPVLSIYLCDRRIKRLEDLYGEQHAS